MQISPKVSRITQNIIHRFLPAIMTNLPAIFGIAGNQFLPANCRQVPCLAARIECDYDILLQYFFSKMDLLATVGSWKPGYFSVM